MVKYCFLTGCNSHSSRDSVSFHKIPTIISANNKKFRGNQEKLEKAVKLSVKRQKAWEVALKRGKLSETQLNNAFVCGKHFLNGKPADLDDENNPDWAPCIHLGYNSTVLTRNPADLKRYERQRDRGNRGNSPDSVIVSNDTQNESVNSTVCMNMNNDNNLGGCVAVLNDAVGCDISNTKLSTTSTQTDLEMSNLTAMMDQLQLEIQANESLKNDLANSQYNEKAFMNNDNKNKFYTGLSNYKSLKAIHGTILPLLSSNTKPSKLTIFQQLTLTLMKLRLNLPFSDLAYRFDISTSTVTYHFRNVVHVLYHTFKNLVYWPDRETLHSTMPACFQETFDKKITTIIDCFEIITEHPGNLASAAACWSNYKHNLTAKVLIGITPQGSVCFVSEAWGGRVSDKALTESSELLNKILPGDVILADRGFLIHDAVQALHATLLMPAFTKGKNQLHPLELEESRSVAHVRIHVERVIGYLRQIFLILSEKLPVTMLVPDVDGNSVLDQILVVCCFLLNLNPGVVNLE